ncbi:hypothetical protein DXG03_002786 [Asterophora parasitica]|uniref:SET domain-containing protein n=1 Tax=Asterophora parasitica TaxID=117018 RepID=A0A9P7G419_9AGAR|nr:hypothetical protein DXG03_002786 [Asterophora parasitica]
MKRGFLKNSKPAKTPANRTSTAGPPATTSTPAPDPDEFQPMTRLRFGKVEPALRGYQALQLLRQAVNGQTTDYSDNTVFVSTLPPLYPNETLASNPDSWTECVFWGGDHKRTIVSTPGFPSPIPRPRQVLHRVAPSRFGMGVFATRNIAMDDLIVSERPLLMAPHVIPPLPLNFSPDFKPTHAQIMEARMVQYEQYLDMALERMFPENCAAFLALHNAHTEDGSGPIYGRVRTNNILALDEPGGDSSRAMIAVFKDISRINHSCVPNAEYGKLDVASLSLQLHAIRDIKKGEEIFIAYCPPTMPTTKRQAKLEPYGFQCTCRVCSDPNSDAFVAKVKSLTSNPLAPTALIQAIYGDSAEWAVHLTEMAPELGNFLNRR